MHTLDVTLRERSGQSLLGLPSATISVPRRRILESYDRMDAAGTALRWLRKTSPARTPEPALWSVMQSFLDLLDRESLPASPPALLTVAGLRLLQALGYALDLERCVTCGRACEEGRAAYLDPARGGLICRRCGGAAIVVAGALRKRLLLASAGKLALWDDDVAMALEIVEAALFAHADVRD